MKKKTLIAIATLVLGLVACNSSDEVIVTSDENNSANEYLIVKQIKEINDSISLCRIPLSRAATKEDELSRADIDGALEGAAIGATIGSIFGSGVPLIGNIGGGFIGALIGSSYMSISSSIHKHKQICGGISDIAPTVNDITKAYCQNYDLRSDNGSAADVYENVLNFPLGLDSLENVGKYHNLTLAIMMKEEQCINLLGKGDDMSKPADDPIESQGTLVSLSEFEQSVVFSDEYISQFNIHMNSITNNEDTRLIKGTVCDAIIQLYIDAMGNYSGTSDIDAVVQLTNQYITIVNDSEELSELEKYNIFLALSVGAYSYKYWAYYNEQNN